MFAQGGKNKQQKDNGARQAERQFFFKKKIFRITKI